MKIGVLELQSDKTFGMPSKPGKPLVEPHVKPHSQSGRMGNTSIVISLLV